MKNAILSIGLVLLVSSCGLFRFHGSMLSRISPGMSKAEVMHQLGRPTGYGGHDNVQILYYQEDMGDWKWNYYFVRLVDGKVEEYGAGDDPTLNLKMRSK